MLLLIKNIQKKLLVIFISLFLITPAFGSNISFNNSFSSEFSIYNKNNMPLWLYAKNEGRLNYTDNNQWLNTINSSFLYSKNNFSTSLAVELNYLPFVNKLYFHNYSITSNFHFLQLNIGRHQFSPIFQQENLGAGSYLFGDNHRPLPRITAGIPTYTKLPWLLDIFSIKGELSYAKLDDKWFEWKHKDEYLHEKYFYITINKWDIQPYGGLNHSTIMGGYKQNGEKIPVDFISTFFAKGSEKIGGGDALNAAGAHMGLYDFGFYIKTKNSNLHIYYQIPFADGSGMQLFVRNIDQIAGIDIQLKNSTKFKNITFEWHNTSFQSGNGTPDFVDNNGKSYTYANIREMGYDTFMAQYGQTQEKPYTQKEVDKFLREEFNDGNRFGGRDGYMSNYLYPTGWTYYGHIMGSPLNLTQQQIEHNSPIIGTYTKNLIANDRYKAIHLGVKGEINPLWLWTFKTTISKNYGTYFQEYPGRYTWERTEHYYFDSGLLQSYSYLNISHILKTNNAFKISSEIGYDYGKINKSIGLNVKMIYYL